MIVTSPLKYIAYLFIGLIFFGNLNLYAQNMKRNFEIEWDPVEEATIYEVEITGLDGKILFLKKLDQPKWSEIIIPGQYKIRTRTYDQRKVPGPWSDQEKLIVPLTSVIIESPKNKAVIFSENDSEDQVSIKWNAVSYAETYLVEVKSSDNSFSLSETLKAQINTIDLKLPVAKKYQVQIRAQNNSIDVESEKPSDLSFILVGSKLKPVEFETPENEFVRQIIWSTVEYANNYQYRLVFNPPGKGKSITEKGKVKSNQLKFKKEWKGGSYTLEVRAEASLRKFSKWTQLDFKVKDGDRSKEAEFISELRKSIDRLSGWYGIASYLITQINYESSYFQNSYQTKANFSTLAGTGRLGLGYLSDRSLWGGQAIVDLSGMTNQDNKNVTFSSFELMAIYRYPISGRDDLRTRFGIYQKELPFAVTTNLGKVVDYKNLNMQGFMFGAEYWYSVSPKLGAQGHAYLYQSLAGQNAVSSEPLEPQFSYQVGVLGSYRLAPRMTGLMGLTKRIDTGAFKANINGNQKINNLIIDGTYLNLFLEYGF